LNVVPLRSIHGGLRIKVRIGVMIWRWKRALVSMVPRTGCPPVRLDRPLQASITREWVGQFEAAWPTLVK
jgi:hypothetical protein